MCDCVDCRVWKRYDRAWANWRRAEELFERASDERREASSLLVAHYDELGRRAA